MLAGACRLIRRINKTVIEPSGRDQPFSKINRSLDYLISFEIVLGGSSVLKNPNIIRIVAYITSDFLSNARANIKRPTEPPLLDRSDTVENAWNISFYFEISVK